MRLWASWQLWPCSLLTEPGDHGQRRGNRRASLAPPPAPSPRRWTRRLPAVFVATAGAGSAVSRLTGGGRSARQAHCWPSGHSSEETPGLDEIQTRGPAQPGARRVDRGVTAGSAGQNSVLLPPVGAAPPRRQVPLGLVGRRGAHFLLWHSDPRSRGQIRGVSTKQNLCLQATKAVESGGRGGACSPAHSPPGIPLRGLSCPWLLTKM